MDNCTRCKSTRLLYVGAKTSDMCWARLGTHDHNGYVPEGFGIGGGDYLDIEFCLDCGQVQLTDQQDDDGNDLTFPLPKHEWEGP